MTNDELIPSRRSLLHSSLVIRHSSFDALLLLILAALAVLPPVRELHKQLTLAAIAIVQLLEGRMVVWLPRYGRGYAVLLKIVLATLLLDHTGEMGINSGYWPIYF